MKNSRWLCLFWILFLALAGCQPVPPSRPAGLVVAAPKGVQAARLAAAAAAYQKAGGEAVQVLALGSQDYADAVNAALIAGLDRYDLVYLPAEALAKWAGYHALQPLDLNAVERSALEPWLPAVTVDGQLYGVPTQPDPVGLWYRTDRLAAAGLPAPRDWESLRRAALALQGQPGQMGAAIAGNELDAGLDFAAVLAGFGGQAVSPAYQVELDSPLGVQALRFYAGLAATGGANRQNLTRVEVQAALSSGRAGLGIGPLSAGDELFDCKAAPKVCQGGRPLLAFAWLPGLAAQQAMGGLDAWATPAHAAHPQAAGRFAAWLGSAAGAQAWAQAGGVPAHRGVLATLAPAPAALLAGVSDYRLAFPPDRVVDPLWSATNGAVSAVVSGKQPAEQALPAAAEKMRVALRSAGY